MTFYSHIPLQPSMYSTLLIFFFVTYFLFLLFFSLLFLTVLKKYKLRNMINYVAGIAVKGKVVYMAKEKNNMFWYILDFM